MKTKRKGISVSMMNKLASLNLLPTGVISVTTHPRGEKSIEILETIKENMEVVDEEQGLYLITKLVRGKRK